MKQTRDYVSEQRDRCINYDADYAEFVRLEEERVEANNEEFYKFLVESGLYNDEAEVPMFDPRNAEQGLDDYIKKNC